VFVVVGNIFFLLSLQTLLCLFSQTCEDFPKVCWRFERAGHAREKDRQREREEGRKESIAYVDAALLVRLLSLFLLLLS
jgi:hypothetical protein